MERALELLVPGTDAPYEIILQSISASILRDASEQQKHKLKVRLSSLLRASGSPNASRERVLGCLLVRRVICDWSILHSHGSNWVVALLHILTLPQKTGWIPAIRSLVAVFDRVHGKADLSREIAAAKVGDFAKKLASLLDKAGAPIDTICYAVRVLAPRYEPQFRPSIDILRTKLSGFAQSKPDIVAPALAALTLAEKQTAESWSHNVAKILTEIKELDKDDDWENAAQTTLLFAQLREYVKIAGAANGKLNSNSLMAVVDESLQSLKANRVLATLRFVYETRDVLATVYMRRFDRMLYVLAECADINLDCFIYTARLLTWLFNAIGGISPEHSGVISKLAKRALAVLSVTSPIGAAGLADHVKAPKSFETTASPDHVLVVSQLFQALIISVPRLSQSLRARIDRFLLAGGDKESIRISALYPGRFSIAPMAIAGTEMVGYEAIVHPRLPALGADPLTAERAQLDVEDEVDEPDVIEVDAPTEVIAQVVETESEPAPEIVEPVVLPVVEALPTFTKVEATESEPPLKRSRSDPADEESTAGASDSKNDDEDDDEFVLPTLIL